MQQYLSQDKTLSRERERVSVEMIVLDILRMNL